MKITHIEAFPVWGGHRNFLFVVVDTDEGISGVSEAGLTGRELAVLRAIEHFKPLLTGQDPARIRVGVPPVDRRGVDRLRARGPVHRGRFHGGAQDRRLV